ncbi:hypothetical protein LUZ63_015211 [Rhynchospora breviuscula]|uniref:Uncharacterized protein n=1 Tax=Rhynchospora breviuscula TaxID=2022672 RepID=A0A9Q0CBW8_9POAL|nr:hypothetical protein LUZ63_015211 [Rhynchospora breviuscula]
MDIKQLERNSREILTKASGEDNFVDSKMKIESSDHEEPAEIDPMDGVDSGTNLPMKRAHTLYFVKVRSYELDQKLQCRIEQAKSKIQRRRSEIFQVTEELRSLKSKKSSILVDMKINNMKDNQSYIEWKSKWLEHLQDILNKETRKNGTRPRLSEKYELFDLTKERRIIRKESLNSDEEKRIKYLNHCIQNQRLTSKEEKALLKQTKELETTRDKAIEVAAEASLKDKKRQEYEIRSQIFWRRQKHKSIEEYVRIQVQNIEWCKQRKLESTEILRHLRKHLDVVDKQMQKLEERLKSLNMKMDKAHAVIVNSENLLDKRNSGYLQSRELLDDAEARAEQKDVPAIAELSKAALEKFSCNGTRTKVSERTMLEGQLPRLKPEGSVGTGEC